MFFMIYEQPLILSRKIICLNLVTVNAFLCFLFIRDEDQPDKSLLSHWLMQSALYKYCKFKTSHWLIEQTEKYKCNIVRCISKIDYFYIWRFYSVRDVMNYKCPFSITFCIIDLNINLNSVVYLRVYLGNHWCSWYGQIFWTTPLIDIFTIKNHHVK